MITNEEMVKWQKEKKYVDLALIIEDQSIYVHKFWIGKKSAFLEMLICREQEKVGAWPPIFILHLSLPDNLSFSALNQAINYLYDKSSPIDIAETIDGLIYLSVDYQLINKLLIKYLPAENLSADQVALLVRLYPIFDSQDIFRRLLEYYGNELAVTLPFLSTTRFYKKELSSEDLMEKYNRYQKINKLPDYTAALSSEWIHVILGSKKSDVKVTALGIIWTICRFRQYWSDGDVDEIVKMYVHSTNEPNATPSKLRATFMVYSRYQKISTKIVIIKNFIPDQYKHDYMVTYHKSNKLGLGIGDEHDPQIKVSILLETLEWTLADL